MKAAAVGNVDVARHLVEKGADIDAADKVASGPRPTLQSVDGLLRPSAGYCYRVDYFCLIGTEWGTEGANQIRFFQLDSNFSKYPRAHSTAPASIPARLLKVTSADARSIEWCVKWPRVAELRSYLLPLRYKNNVE
jgi:hypothetical protein